MTVERVPGGITCLIHTKQEQERIGHAVRSVRSWVDEVVVIDMMSTDATRQIAADLGARVVTTPDVGFADPARAAAVAAVTTEWVLVLDADEVVPMTLARRLSEIARRDEADVVVIPWLNYFMGSPMRTTDWGPAHDKHARFFRHGQVVYSEVVHVLPAIADGARVLDLPPEPDLCVHHFNYDDFSHFLQKLDRYTDFEAQALLAQPDGRSLRRALTRSGKEFARRWVKNRGYKEDYRAFVTSALMVAYRLVAWAKAEQLARTGDRAAVRAHYLEVAEELVTAYEPRP